MIAIQLPKETVTFEKLEEITPPAWFDWERIELNGEYVRVNTTKQGWTIAMPGDYIIRNEAGEFDIARSIVG